MYGGSKPEPWTSHPFPNQNKLPEPCLISRDLVSPNRPNLPPILLSSSPGALEEAELAMAQRLGHPADRAQA